MLQIVVTNVSDPDFYTIFPAKHLWRGLSSIDTYYEGVNKTFSSKGRLKSRSSWTRLLCNFDTGDSAFSGNRTALFIRMEHVGHQSGMPLKTGHSRSYKTHFIVIDCEWAFEWRPYKQIPIDELQGLQSCAGTSSRRLVAPHKLSHLVLIGWFLFDLQTKLGIFSPGVFLHDRMHTFIQ